MKIGLILHPERGMDFVYEEARQADLQGFDSVWLGDHLFAGHGAWKGANGPYGPLETFTLMAAIAAVTTRTKLAWSILNVNFRRPAILAKSLATLDQISKGRVICSVGSGSVPVEHHAYGVPILEHDARVEYLREVVMLFKQLWSNPAPALTNFKSAHITVEDLPFNPKPYQKPSIPIWIGGESDPTVQVMKDLADGWVTLTRHVGHAEEKDRVDPAARIREVVSSSDWPKRPMTVTLQSQLFVAESHEAAVADAKSAMGDKYGLMDGSITREIVGTPDECLEHILEIEKAGINYLRITFSDLSQQERAARLLLPKINPNSSPLYMPVEY